MQAGHLDRIAVGRRPLPRLHPSVHRDHVHGVEQDQQDRRQPDPGQPAAGGRGRIQGNRGHAVLPDGDDAGEHARCPARAAAAIGLRRNP